MRARKPRVVKENTERWLLTYSDLITLLLIFFILLYSISTTDARKFEDLTGALQQAFNNGSYQLVTLGGTPGSPHAFSGATPSQKAAMSHLQGQILQMLRMLGIPQNVVTVGLSHEGLVISISGTLLFYPGGTQLMPESTVVLAQMAPILSHLPNEIRVEGNTDNQASGPAAFNSNWALSALRAVAIVQFFSAHAVAPTRL